MSLPEWGDQPREEARLLNPAFIAALLWACADGHGAETGTGLPYPLPALPRSMLQQRPLTSFPAPFPLWLNTCYFASQSLLLAQFPNMSRMAYTPDFACSLLLSHHHGYDMPCPASGSLP